MASGKTHDGITWALLPVVFVGATAGLGWYWLDAACLTAGTAIGGLLLSPDLDTRSRPFYRWGVFRFVWRPYQWVAKHRSTLSHGVFVAPVLRALYLSAVLILFYFAFIAVLQMVFPVYGEVSPRQVVLVFLQRHVRDLLLLLAGVWLGSLSHVATDWLSDRWLPRSRRKRR